MAKKTPQDPTGMRYNRAKSIRQLSRRLSVAQLIVLNIVRSLPTRLKVNEYDYSLVTPQALAETRRIITDVMYGQLETEEDETPFVWWFTPRIEQPYRQGAIEEVTELNRVLFDAVMAGSILLTTIPVDTYLTTKVYRDGLQLVKSEVYHSIKSLGQRTADQVMRVINDGIQAGISKQEIARQVLERFEVSKSAAKRIVDTEVNKSYNDSRIRAIQTIRDETGLNFMVEHISALLPTTRKHHADRHHHIYTPSQQTAWWNKGANRISCHCSVRSVLNENTEGS